jgi:hypothetical protein
VKWNENGVLELEGAELLVDHLPDDLVGGRHRECVGWIFVVVVELLLRRLDVRETFLIAIWKTSPRHVIRKYTSLHLT